MIDNLGRPVCPYCTYPMKREPRFDYYEAGYFRKHIVFNCPQCAHVAELPRASAFEVTVMVKRN